jgi:hypothetical protein
MRRIFSSGVHSKDNGRGGKTGKLLGGEACRMECEVESKPHGTAKLIRCIPSGVMKSVGKK